MNDREEQLRGKLYAGMTKRKEQINMPRPPTHSEMITVEPSDLVQDVLSILEGANIPTEVNDLIVERIEKTEGAQREGHPFDGAADTAPTLSHLHEIASDRTYRLYCAGSRWMDRARKAEHLNSGLLEVLKLVRERCLYGDENVPGGIGVTTEPHIDEQLFNQICAAIKRTDSA